PGWPRSDHRSCPAAGPANRARGGCCPAHQRGLAPGRARRGPRRARRRGRRGTSWSGSRSLAGMTIHRGENHGSANDVLRKIARAREPLRLALVRSFRTTPPPPNAEAYKLVTIGKPMCRFESDPLPLSREGRTLPELGRVLPLTTKCDFWIR